MSLEVLNSLAHDCALVGCLASGGSGGSLLLIHEGDLALIRSVLTLEGGESVLLLLVEFAVLCYLVEISELVEDFALLGECLLYGLK